MVNAQTDLAEAVLRRLCCPVCRAPLRSGGKCLTCADPQCGSAFPVVDGIPVLINEANSLFRIDDFLQHRDTTMPTESRLRRTLLKLVPALGRNMRAQANYRELARVLLQRSPTPSVLVVGGGIAGEGMAEFLSIDNVETVETDVALGPRTQVVCDAHDIPFQDNSFDGVIVQAVLEHVIDPPCCVDEIHRVLMPGGVVYAETAFMQQVHEGRYDFLRFSHLGHRRLFRRFEEIASGPVCGPGMALAWSWHYFLRAFFESRPLRQAMTLFASLTAWWCKYADYILIRKRGAYDCAAGYYFMGAKSDRALTDRDVIKGYRGLVGMRG